MAYITPYINITYSNNLCNDSNNKKNIGKLKDEIDIDEIMPFMYKNQEFVNYVNASNYHFIPHFDYYNDKVAEIFDIYGGVINKNINDIEYYIQIYFYKIKHTELITKEIINTFKLIFKYDYFVKNNILNMTWHNYRFNKYFIDKLKEHKFMDEYKKPDYCLTELFSHQKNNLARMFHIHNNPTIVHISDNMPIHFDNELIFDMVKEKFISQEDIPTCHINSGMILDEPGTGKTLQFILYLLEIKQQSLVLVPNEDIKCVWMDEFKKHINNINMCFDIMTFDELKQMIEEYDNYLNQYKIIGIDEIHNLYNKPCWYYIFNKIVTSSIKYRWGITGTSFVSDTSFFQIIKFLTGQKFNNEKIVNSPYIQDQLIKLFLKNYKTDMVEYQWPELNITDVFIKLDIVQQNMYDAEKMLYNKENLRRLVCEINLMLGDGEFNTPYELKLFGIKHYQKLYENEKEKLDKLHVQLKNIEKNIDNFEHEEYHHRIEHFKELINKQNEKTEHYKKVSDYFMTAIDNINKFIENKSIDDNEDGDMCSICWEIYTPPITYIKSCGHYFCKSCIDMMMKHTNQKCPNCRKEIITSDLIHVQQISDINNSPKIHELLNIIKDGHRYIIFTQFDKVIDKIQKYLHGNKITSSTLNNYNQEQILLLSSQQNAEGINLSMFDKMIIFEPFEDNIYCSEVEKQLIARIHRIGRLKQVDVYRFITKGTIEEDIYHFAL